MDAVDDDTAAALEPLTRSAPSNLWPADWTRTDS
jgi:hypothetical protein